MSTKPNLSGISLRPGGGAFAGGVSLRPGGAIFGSAKSSSSSSPSTSGGGPTISPSVSSSQSSSAPTTAVSQTSSSASPLSPLSTSTTSTTPTTSISTSTTSSSSSPSPSSSSYVSSPGSVSTVFSFSAGGKRVSQAKPAKPQKVFAREFIMSFKDRCLQIPPDLVRVEGIFCVEPFGSPLGYADTQPPASATAGSLHPLVAATSYPSPPSMLSPYQEKPPGEKWVSPSAVASLNFALDPEILKKQKFANDVRKVLGLLNRLAEENYDSVSKKILKHSQSTDVALLKVIASHVFDKAVSEPGYARMWGNLCSALAKESNNHFDFRKELITMCQEQFVKSFEVVNEEAGQPVLNEEDPRFPEFEELRLKRKSRRLGNISFIGELYIQNLLPVRVILFCLSDLIQTAENPNLHVHVRSTAVELFCKLLLIVGQQLESSGPKPEINAQFAKVNALISARSGPSALPIRIRFMLEDLVKQRKSQWFSKKRSAGPPTPSSPTSSAATLPPAPGPSSAPSVADLPPGLDPYTLLPPTSSISVTSPPLLRPSDNLTDAQQRKVDELLEEYLAGYDLAEAALCVRELKFTEFFQFGQLVYSILLGVLQQPSVLVPSLRLLSHLLNERILSIAHLASATVLMIGSIEDLVVDFGSRVEEVVLLIVSNLIADRFISVADVLTPDVVSPLLSSRFKTLSGGISALLHS